MTILSSNSIKTPNARIRAGAKAGKYWVLRSEDIDDYIISKPSLRIYVGAGEIPQVRKGLGIKRAVTPKGVLVDREARKQRVGGELLCQVW